MEDLDYETLEMLDTLRARGFAVAVFSPTDLRGADPDTVEDHLVMHGNEAINHLAIDPPDEDDDDTDDEEFDIAEPEYADD